MGVKFGLNVFLGVKQLNFATVSKYGRIAVKRDDFEKQENNVQQPVKLLLVPVPLDAVQCVPFHVKPALLLVTMLLLMVGWW